MNSISKFLQQFDWVDFALVGFFTALFWAFVALLGVFVYILWVHVGWWVVIGPTAAFLFVLLIYYIIFCLDEGDKNELS